MVETYNTKELAELMKVSRETVRRWYRNGDIKGTRIGAKGRLRFEVDEDTKEIRKKAPTRD